MRFLRLLTVAAAASVLALPAAAVASRADDRAVDRGVVQSVGQGQIVLRALDGSILTFSAQKGVKVLLNGARASLAEIQPGFVASVYHDDRGRVRLVEAFGARPAVTHTGLVTGLTANAITLRTAGGGALTVPLDRSTRFRFLGLAAKRSLARPGALVAVVHVADGPALVVNVLKRAGA